MAENKTPEPTVKADKSTVDDAEKQLAKEAAETFGNKPGDTQKFVGVGTDYMHFVESDSSHQPMEGEEKSDAKKGDSGSRASASSPTPPSPSK